MPSTLQEFLEQALKDEPKINEDTLNEGLSFITVWQDEHKSSIGWSDKPENNGGRAYTLGNIPHGATFMFDKKEVPRIIKILKMKNSPLVKG